MRIRLTTFARPDDDLLKRFSLRYIDGKTVWKDLQFVTDESYDRLVILTYPYERTLQQGYLPEKSIIFMTEPSVSYFAKAHPTGAVMDIHLHLPFFPMRSEGMCGTCLREDIALLKKDVLSCIVSELSGLEGHNRRLEFVYVLDQLFEEGLDIFGRPSKGNFFQQLSNYRGFLPDKYDGLWSYCYHFACENCFQEGYFTEKIVDPIITEYFCFYNGCPDIENYRQ